MIWPHVTKQHPCGICGKPDAQSKKREGWCQVGSYSWLCKFVESKHPNKNGGWFHFFTDKIKPVVKYRPAPEPPKIDCEEIIGNWMASTEEKMVEAFAAQIGVSADALYSIGIAYSRADQAWAFPMRDGYENIVGIRLRYDNGQKKAVYGSKQGIFIPNLPTIVGRLAFICEGPTDTAAMLSLGFYAVGRPSCLCGGDQIKVFLNRISVRMAVIAADSDKPGQDGAVKLAKELGVKCVIWTSPAKDIREFVKIGGTKADVESELKNFVWMKYN